MRYLKNGLELSDAASDMFVLQWLVWTKHSVTGGACISVHRRVVVCVCVSGGACMHVQHVLESLLTFHRDVMKRPTIQSVVVLYAP